MIMSGRRFALAALAALAVVTAGATGLRRRIAIVTVEGPSMQPTLADGERVLVRRAGAGTPRRGQIVVIEKPGDDGGWHGRPQGWSLSWPDGRREWLIKRVAAVPGDRRPDAMPERAARSPVPAGHLAVLGDNASRSFDSRQFGYVPADRILGVVCWSQKQHTGP